MITHPSQDQWMDYLYNEMATIERNSLEQHLKGCPECRARQMDFKAATESLDRWQVILPERHRFAPRWEPTVKWAAAAVLLVSTVFATGRMSRPEIDAAVLQAEVTRAVEARIAEQAEIASAQALRAAEQNMKAQWQAQIREEMAGKVEQATQRVMVESVQVLRKQLEELSITLAALREEDKKSLAAALSTLEERRLADFRRLREDLERVALFTDENFRAAQRQLVHLTSFSQDPEEN